MFSKQVRLVCSILALSVIPLVQSQATATSSSNGIVSAAGGPEATQSISYSIQGSGIVAAATATSNTIANTSQATSAVSTGGSVIDGTENRLTDIGDHGLSVPAILGITLAVVLAVVSIVLVTIVIHRRRQQSIARAKRKSIMDVEFGAKTPLERVETGRSSTDKTVVGYFDVAKPLPAIVSEKLIEADRLSRSSTIIADAAEVAQINRKASTHQSRHKHKKSRAQQRERNQALQILITNEENRTSVLSMPRSPLTSNSTSPVDQDLTSPIQAHCPDGNGDAFAKRPSKL